MALKKDHVPRFTRPMSNMRVVLMSIEQGNHSIGAIEGDTNLNLAAIRSAIMNLLYIAAIQKSDDRQGRRIYYVQGQIVHPVGDCWKYASSAFHPSIR
jgi:putative exporter of polyketide antibiotics